MAKNFVKFSYLHVLKELWLAGKQIFDSETGVTTLPGPLSWGGGAEIESSDLVTGEDLDEKADETHHHDDRYFTEDEIESGYFLNVKRKDDLGRRLYLRGFPISLHDRGVAMLLLNGDDSIDFEKQDGVSINLSLEI